MCRLAFGFSGPPCFFPPHFQIIKAIFQNLLSNIVTTLPLQHLEVGKHCIPLNFKDKMYFFGKYIYIYIKNSNNIYTAGEGGSPRGRQSGSLNWRKNSVSL